MPSFTRTKYIVFILLGLIVLGAIGFVFYSYLAPSAPRITPSQPGISGKPIGGPVGAPAGAPTPPVASAPPMPSLPSITEQRLTRLTDFPVISPSLNKDETKILFYKKEGGDLFAVDFKGQQQDKVAHVTVIGLIEAVWPSTRDRAAVFYASDDTIKGFLHISTSSIAILPGEIKSFAWSPDGRSLAYLVPKDDGLNLVIADAAGKNPKTVFKTPILDAHIAWVSPEKIAFITAPSGLAEGFIFTYSRSTGAFTKVLGPIFGLASLWSPDASQILISHTSRGGTRLATQLYDIAKKQTRTVDAATLSEKCMWAGAKEIYCAVPQSVPQTTLMPDDYLRGEYHSSDRIVRIDADKTNTATIFDEGNFDMSDLTITKDQNILFFVNRIDGTLWSLRLK